MNNIPIKLSPTHSADISLDSFGTFSQKRKSLALEMAQLLYDIYIEKEQTDIIENGQNNAQQDSSN